MWKFFSIITTVLSFISGLLSISTFLSSTGIKNGTIDLIKTPFLSAFILLLFAYLVSVIFIWIWYAYEEKLKTLKIKARDEKKEAIFSVAAVLIFWAPASIFWVLFAFNESNTFTKLILMLVTIFFGVLFILIIAAAIFEFVFPYSEKKYRFTNKIKRKNS